MFLPHGTELRMAASSRTGYARVVGDKIVYQGLSVSPRGLPLAIAGEGRNAWRDLWIKFPEQQHWRSANFYRAQARAAVAAPVLSPALSPAESMRMAAAVMAQALDTALLLVKQSYTAHPAPP